MGTAPEVGAAPEVRAAPEVQGTERTHAPDGAGRAPDGAGRAPGAPLAAALALRFLVLKRRYGSPFEAVALVVVTLLAGWLGGKAATPRISPGLASAALSGLVAGGALLGLRGAWQLLYRRKELALLLGNGLSHRGLLALRLCELSLGLGLVSLPLLTAVRGLHLGAGPADATSSPWLWLCALPLGLGLASLGLLAAWSLASFSANARRALSLGLVLALCGSGLTLALLDAPTWRALSPLKPLVSGPQAPGPLLLRVARGELAPLLGASAAALALAALCLSLAWRGQLARLDRSAPRGAGRASFPWLGELLARAWPGRAGALARRDLLLVARGAAPRAFLILGGLPCALALIPAFASDTTLLPWQLRFASLLLVGSLAASAGFLFGVDLPLTRRSRLILERTQALRGREVLLSRWVCAGGCALLLALGAALLVAKLSRPELAAEALPLLWSALPLALLVSHHAVTFGLRGEAEANPAEASAYPFNGGVLVLGFAFLLTFHWALALLYPLGWLGFTRQALVIWERSEVANLPEAAA